MTLFLYITGLLIQLLVLIPWISCATLTGVIHQKSGMKLIRLWIKFLFYTFNVNITVENENESLQRLKGCVFTLLNQTSLLDGPIGVLVYPLPCMWLANIEYALIPFFGWCMWVFGWVIIRQMPKQAKRTLNKAVAFLENGGNLWVSIEGRRSKHGFLSPYKKGPVVLAIKAQADIVPIAIYGAKNCISYCNYTKKSKEVIIKVFEAIPTKGLEYRHRDIMVDKLQQLGRIAIATEKVQQQPNNTNSADS